MKNYSEFKTELEQIIQEVDEKTKDWSNEDWEKDWKKTEMNTMMEYYKDLSEGEPYTTDPCIYKSVFEEGIQRRKKSQTEYMSRVSRLYQDLKQTQGDDKIDVLGKLIEVIIQHQLFGMK